MNIDGRKLQKWNDIVASVDKITDRLEMPVDEKIKPVVVGLMALGFKTVNSCEGHLDYGRAHPAVDIETDYLARPWGDGPPPKDPPSAWVDYCRDARAFIRPTVKRAFDLLEEFYKDRDVHHDARIVVFSGGISGMTIENGYGQITQWLSDSGQAERLKEYQEEMLAFGEFLKNKFFQS